MLHRAPPPKRPYFAASAHFSLRVLTPTFTAYILATHWLRGGYTRTVTIWGSYPHFHLLTSCSTYHHSYGFFASYWLYYTHSFIPFFIHSTFPVTKENVIGDWEKGYQIIIILLFVHQLIKAVGWGGCWGGSANVSGRGVFILWSPKTTCPVFFSDI